MKKNTQVLLIAFKYPPYAGVGGFRWSKLSKYLAKMGYTIHVVTVNWKEIGKDTFSEDVCNPNIIIHRIPCFYPFNLKYKRYENTHIGRLKHVMKYGFFKIIDLLIWYEDEAQYWNHSLLPYCKKLVKEHKIKTVIATGHPFMANYWASKLKQELPEITLIQDFRDSWNDKRKNYLLPYFRKKSLQHELFAFNHCDVLFTVSKSLMDLLSKKIHTDVEKVVIHNGFDIPLSGRPPLKRTFSFLYAGGVYYGREEALNKLLQAVDEIKSSLSQISIQFYGDFPNNLKKKFAHLFTEGIILHCPWISPEQIQKKMYESFVCLHFNSRIFPYALSTKIYEYASLRRPTLLVNYGGELDELIKKHKLGVSVNGDDLEKIKEEILKFYHIWKQNPSYEICPKGIEIYHYELLAEKIARYIK